AREAGFPLTRDYNGAQQEGVGYSQMTRRGRLRGSTARTFLAEARRRQNLRVETKAVATRLLFDGRRCTGVAFRQNGSDRRVAAAGRGALTFGVTTAMVFCRSREGLASPDLQLLFTPGSYDPEGIGRLEREPGMTIVVCAVRPDSRGTIMARSADPLQPPAIRPNYLSAASDEQVLLSGTRHARRIFAAAPLARHSAAETMPGFDADSNVGLIDFMH